MVSIEKISINDIKDLKLFIKNLGSSADSFRYFETRPLEIIEGHTATFLAYNNDREPIGYGHLDPENNTTWLGIAVIEKYTQQGIGSQILNSLLIHANQLNLTVKLSVDQGNTKAKELYLKNGFEELKESNNKVAFMKKSPCPFYISSLAFLGEPIETVLEICEKHNFPLEFSSGLPFSSEIEDIYNESSLVRMPHNYFPAPEIPFVLNLASKNETIRQQSINHCLNGLKLAKNSNSPFFAAHAGFCIDPDPNELGKKIAYDPLFDIELHKSIFIQSLEVILKQAELLEIDFLIENNVLAPFNYNGKNPLLCCESQDINWLMSTLPHHRLGILLDTAHLKVSAQTLDLDLNQEVEQIKPFVRGIHHSDNDGTKDDNQSITDAYWFLPFYNSFKNLPQVLEVKNLTVNEIKTQLKIFNYGY